MAEHPIIFSTIFGTNWQQLPTVFKRHYANRAYVEDKVSVRGTMTIKSKGLMKWFGPVMGAMGTLPPYAANDIPITVDYVSHADSNAFHLKRTFYYPDRSPYIFNSKMIPLVNNIVVELTRWNIGWKTAFEFDGSRVILRHQGYVLKCFKWYIPLPVEWIIGRCDAQELALSDTQFRMKMQFMHPWFGEIYAYFGDFTLT